jgi:hypothetical protein
MRLIRSRSQWLTDCVREDEHVTVTRRQGQLLKALHQRGQVALDERLIYLERHCDWERKELAKSAQKGVIEKIDDGSKLSDEGAEFLERASLVVARFRDRGIDVDRP